MPNLAQAEVALTRLSPCWERGASPPAACNSRSAIFPGPHGAVSAGPCPGPWDTASLCLLHKDAAVWARLEVAPLASRRREGHCLVPASLLETPSAPQCHPRAGIKTAGS